MKVIWEQGNEAKLTEEKRKHMNELVGLNNVSVGKDITLLINDWCSQHIRTLHKENPNTEWLAVCKVQPKGEWIFVMTDMLFPWQKTTGWDVETTEEWMKWLTEKLIERWEKMTDWNCILHSHHHMWCFWSWTDDKARLWLNDGRQLAWAVVTAYSWDEISYKGCINFYKPYNIEIDVNVKDEECDSVVNRYREYEQKLKEYEARFYEHLLDINKNYIEWLTERPSYSWILDYLWVDISDELNANYDTLKDKVWNPELIDYMKELWNKANELAVNEINESWEYSDTVVEYNKFCEWSDGLLEQLEQNKEKAYTFSTTSQWLFSQTTYPLNRSFTDEYDYGLYEFTSPQYDESYVRMMFGIDTATPMKVGEDGERMAWSNDDWDYIYVEDWAENCWYC